MSESRPAVVLVAERTLSANYRVLFEGIFATMQTTVTPAWMMRRLLAPPVPTDAAGRAAVAPLGLRRLEATLLAAGVVDPADLVVTTPEALPRLLGPWTKIVAVSSSDPLGHGMSNTTTREFCGGTLYTRQWMADLMADLCRAKARHGFRIVVGGAGVWQYDVEPAAVARHGVDVRCRGWAETAAPGLFRDLLAGGDPPAEVRGGMPATGAEIPALRHPSMLGVVELSRGCGRGCKFCVMGRERMIHLPAATVLADLETNLAGGVRNVVSASEDLFRYGADGDHLRPDRLIALLESLRALDGLRFMQIDHANVSSILAYSDAELREVRDLLRWRNRVNYLWVNLGAESANGHLVAANGPGKLGGHDPDTWEEMVLDAADKAARTGFYPVFSIIIGLPGETPSDVRRTAGMVQKLGRRGCVVFPIFHEPPGAEGRRLRAAELGAEQFALFEQCYNLNFRHVPPLYADNQRAGGVPGWQRGLVQILGRAEVLAWRWRFRRLRPSDPASRRQS